MGKGKVVSLVVLGLVLLSVLSLLWYKAQYSMAIATAFDRGSPQATPRILIATQGSRFKDALVAGILDRLTSSAPYIKVIDVSALPGVQEDAWNAIVIVHTWENWRPQADAKAFFDTARDRSKLIVVSTSGSGREKMPGVDAVSAASVMDDVPKLVGEVLARLDSILKRVPSS